MKNLKMYTVFIDQGTDSPSVLVFHYSAREAKNIAYPIIMGWSTDYEFIEIKVLKIREATWLWEEKEMDLPHVIESPKSCKSCGHWGQSEIINGFCDECRPEPSGLGHWRPK